MNYLNSLMQSLCDSNRLSQCLSVRHVQKLKKTKKCKNTESCVIVSQCMSNTPFTGSSKHRANLKQTSSKHQAIRAHVVHVYFEYICLMVA